MSDDNYDQSVNAVAAFADAESVDDGERTSQASLIVRFVTERFELFHDINKDVFAQDRMTGEVANLQSRQFRDRVVAGFYRDEEKAPRDQSVREAIGTLAGLGRFEGECREVNLRVAGADGRYYLDLAIPGDSRCIEITPSGWQVLAHPPVMFVRPESMQPLPIPSRGGSVTPLWSLANIPEDSRLLVIAWLLEALRPETPYPILELLGEMGSAKSTTHKMLRRIFDPNGCDLRAAPKSVEDVFVSAGVNHLASFENVSHLPGPMQDALCVLVTGGGFAKRKLYSDADESVIVVKRPVLLNGIAAAITAQDLVDRTVSIETPTLTERKEVAALWTQFENAAPAILGGLLDIFVEALRLLPTVTIPPHERPRLVEFARLGIATAQAMGCGPEQFLQQFNKARQESLARTIDASPVAAAVLDWVASGKGHQGPLKELMAAIEPHKPPYSDAWPRSAKGFGDALRRAAPALRQLGVECRSLGKIGGNVHWQIVPAIKLQDSSHESPDVLPDQDIRTSRTSHQELSLSDWEEF